MQLCVFQNLSSLKRRPDRVLLDVQDELGIAVLELHDLGLDDRGDGVAARAHPPAVDLVAGVHDRDVADHGAGLLGEDVQLFAQRPQRHFQVLQDRVGLLLAVEGLLLGAGDGVQGRVVHAAEAERLVRLDQVLAAVGEEHGLHELPRLAEVEELALLLGVAHLQDAALSAARHSIDAARGAVGASAFHGRRPPEASTCSPPPATSHPGPPSGPRAAPRPLGPPRLSYQSPISPSGGDPGSRAALRRSFAYDSGVATT